MRHRHLAFPANRPVEELSTAAIDDLLDRGDLDDWAPLAAAVEADPWGRTAARILTVVAANARYGTAPLWQRFVHGRRAAARATASLGEVRSRHGLSQQQVAARLGVNQPAVSKLEQRSDPSVSTLAAFVAATGGTLELIARYPDGEWEIDLGG